MFIYITIFLLIFVLGLLINAYYRANVNICALKHNNNLINSLLSTLGDGFYLWDEKRRIERFSPNLQILLNTVFYSFDEFADFFEESKELQKKFAEAKKVNKSFTIDLKGQDTEIYCTCYGQSIVDNNGQIMGVLLWVQNITNYKLAITSLEYENTTLKENLLNYTDILNNLPYPLWKRDKDFKIKTHNSFYSELVQHNINIDIDQNPQFISKKNNTINQKVQYAIINNERKLYNMIEIPIKNSTEFIGYGEDITRLNYFTQELKNYTTLQTNLLNNLPNAVAIYNRDGSIIFYNKIFTKLWQLNSSWLDTNPNYSSILQKIYEDSNLLDKEKLDLIHQQQHEIFKQVTEPYHGTMILKDNITLKVIVIPNFKQELTFIYNK
ncbi:hypothetical protein [Ehrlichia canis]|uniref:Uncharacterized protein n=1 Tax=Ehrlichia canis (strain Jake) TaxID=269484 RepID=A0ACA6AVA3_EHRCJ|nr:hypothetical protein [Ehrlichia canis]AAZ68248.1 conserved hypothetical protein [Ehrlichia canis str. Jake]AUO54990.1 hypothetical protein C1I72_03915 [Ehrlichia canis]UKC53234.1 hypothetical protein s20019040002_000277 [Ehrlichia canis]UKC54171.1 hypothetical protein s20026770001_000277 [Ehrlichia canis]UKC55107.1 hypothetical protein s21009500007_000277 [Ehrlichia canis]